MRCKHSWRLIGSYNDDKSDYYCIKCLSVAYVKDYDYNEKRKIMQIVKPDVISELSEVEDG